MVTSKKTNKNKDTSLIIREATKEAVEKATREAEADLQALVPLPKRIKSLSMTCDENFEILMDEGRKVRDVQRQVEAKQKPLVKMCNDLKKGVQDLFKPMLNACVEVLEIVDMKRLEYDRHLEEERRIEQDRLDKEAAAEQKRLDAKAKRKAKKAETPQEERAILRSVPKVEVQQAPEVAPVKVSGVNVAKIWDFEIIDPYEVPETNERYISPGDPYYDLWERKFNRINLLKVRAAVAENDSDQPIPGVRFFQKDSTRYGRL